MNGKYKEIYDSSINNKEKYWEKVSNEIFWYKKPSKILNSDKPPFYKWFEDGVTNTCFNALDLHIEKGRGDKLAIIYDSPITGSKKNNTLKSCSDNFLWVNSNAYNIVESIHTVWLTLIIDLVVGKASYKVNN